MQPSCQFFHSIRSQVFTGSIKIFLTEGKILSQFFIKANQTSSDTGFCRRCQIKLNQLIKKYELKDVTNEEKAAIANDKVPNEKNEINKEQTKIDNDELKNFVKSSNNIILPILFVLIAVVASLWIIYEYKKRKKIKNEDVEKSGSAVQERYKNQ